MDVRQLRYFTHVAECGSFSKAANRLRIAQPALSRHLREMEEELGVILLNRSAQGVSVTEAGERLLLHAKRILADFAELGDSVRGEAMPSGEVRVGLPGTVSELLAVPLIEAAAQRYPNIRIRVVEAMSGYIRDWLGRWDVDLAMIYSASDPRGLAVHHGLSEEICLFSSTSLDERTVPGGEAITITDAARLPLIVPGPGHGLRELIEDAALEGRAAITPAIEIDSYNQIKRLAKRGLGYGILPRMAVQREADGGAFRIWRFEAPAITRKIYLAYSVERPLRTAPRAIGQLSWDIMRQLVRDKIWSAQLSDEANRPNLFA